MDARIISQVVEHIPTKAERRKLQIVEAAIHCYSTLGIDDTTYEKIAGKCHVTRPLIIHYFPEKDQLTDIVIKCIRANFQKVAIAAIQKASTPNKQLEAYVRSTFQWLDEYPSHVRVWLLFYYYCGIKPRYREINTELVQVGHDRITGLVSLIHPSAAKKDPFVRAKMIQVVITGALLSITTEKIPLAKKDFIAETVRLCLDLAKT